MKIFKLVMVLLLLSVTAPMAQSFSEEDIRRMQERAEALQNAKPGSAEQMRLIKEMMQEQAANNPDLADAVQSLEDVEKYNTCVNSKLGAEASDRIMAKFMEPEVMQRFSSIMEKAQEFCKAQQVSKAKAYIENASKAEAKKLMSAKEFSVMESCSKQTGFDRFDENPCQHM